jgi:hypothetical protein
MLGIEFPQRLQRSLQPAAEAAERGRLFLDDLCLEQVGRGSKVIQA